MLAKTQNGTEVSVEFIKDVEPNENGFYCEIRRYDEDGDCEEDASEEKYPIYTGSSGRIHGEKKESIPAKNTVA